MKKSFIAVCAGVFMAISLCFAPACSDKENEVPDETVPELQEGTITFEDAICESIINEENSGTVAVATASNGAAVTYSVSEEEAERFANAFDGKLSIASDGTIQGAYDAIKRFKVDVTASAEKCDAVTAEITVSVVNPHLTYSGRTLADAREGIEYAASVAFVEDEGADVSYKVTEGELPAGLEMDSEGTITGIPQTVGRGEPFTVTASSKGYSDTDAQFTIDVVINHVSDIPSSIVKFEKDEAVVLKEAYIGQAYVNTSDVATATALNNNYVSYRLAEGEELPEGFTLYSNGALIGSSEDLGEYTFRVIASAQGCDDVSCTFTLPVKATRIKYSPVNGTITKGEAANLALNTAEVAEGVIVTYSVTDEKSKATLEEYGLAVTAEGYLTGTPVKVASQIAIVVTASAEGYTSTDATMYIRINEPLQAPANGRFEAEYTDLSGKNGTGYSASPSGTALIDKTLSFASNGAFVNYMHNDSITLEFVVYSDEAKTGVPLYLGIGSELGRVTFSPANLGIYVYHGKDTTGAKTTVNYSGVSVPGGNQTYTEFIDAQFGTVDLAEGWNVIQIAVLTNDLRGAGSTGGPGIDYIRLDTTGIEWIPLTFNMD